MSDGTHRSAIFALASDVIDAHAASDPTAATYFGIAGYDHLLPDLSPAQAAKDIAQTQEFLRRLSETPLVDAVDEVNAALLKERLECALGLSESNETSRVFSVLSSPIGNIRQVFELMPESDVENITARLNAIEPTLNSWKLTLEELRSRGELPPKRHIEGVAAQARVANFASFAKRISPEEGVQPQLHEAAERADVAYDEFATWMTDSLLSNATDKDACGAERYAQWANYWTGAQLDLHDTYQWGYEDLRRIVDRMWVLAEQILPGATSLAQVANYLTNDPERSIHGEEALIARLKQLTQDTIRELNGTHFDIDERIQFCDVRIAPEGSAAAPYYIGPSEDLSRPGTTWYPTLGRTSFPFWSDLGVWFHEAVPGHHLQIATATLELEKQSRFQRLEGGTSGYIEGWALYAERLMDELGYYTKPEYELGFLANQALRAARIVVDIGLHLELAVPEDFWSMGELGDCGGKTWNAEMAVWLLENLAIQSHDMSVSEVDRYLGLPGQAISYKVGERVWLRCRAEAQARLGENFSLKKFHAYALAMGAMGLDPFEELMSQWSGD
jgi:uncharacterized protein (DUF885 family)